MGRPHRAADGGLIYHVLNRANARMTIFEKPEDFAAFERVLEEAVQRTKTRLLAYCVLSTHWLCEAPHNQCYVKLGIM
jgi:putative transposase